MKPILNQKITLMQWLVCMVFSYLLIQACGSKAPAAKEEVSLPTTPVEVVGIGDTTLAEYIDISAVSAYTEKSMVKANINGYIQKANIKLGDKVGRGELMFSLITKEARSIGNAVNKLDPGFKFTGISSIKANVDGIIVQLNHQKGDYVQDGEALASIVNRNSLVFLLNLPYALNTIIGTNKTIAVILPDGVKLDGKVTGTMPAVDSLAQTQRYIIKVNTSKDIPEGLIAKVRLTKLAHQNAQVLPKSAILANETEDEFWVMKLINDSTAVKVKVEKGIENDQTIEVLKPTFLKTDKIISSGNYGLADTAKVKIQK
ncbi:HlyD family efflux transporter periplasmic adaptor subunit [Pedobacter changchengzhani]|uniref:HlyD family efflux transporter periplasmic adaptor subunit n=1 Tax=Pedobacter changchengzhani TaxID=2529274 RepID=A0A4R5MKH3_9SPHI|nr:HlyD family efflux transporter periplasmic adaptor subunit [Pedobacter changchengzhani]TDG36160.1 HlyD family efflux transporter periplasmic adaptor subunit [Pedobacter changchengzhani]